MQQQKGKWVPGFPVLMQAAFWIVLFVFTSYLSIISVGWNKTIARTPLIIVCHLINFYVCYSFLVPRYFEKKKYIPALLGLLLLLVILTPIRFAIEKQFLLLYIKGGLTGRPGLRGLVIFSELAIAGFATLLKLAATNNINQQRMSELEKLQLETELRFLKAQMSPHFLFNTINNIYSLALAKSDKAPEALLKLSALLRYILYECNEKVLLRKEIETLHLYSSLFQLRYEQPLPICIDDRTSPEGTATLEPFLLIPLWENALKHSGAGVSKDAFALVIIEENKKGLMITLKNSRSLFTSDEDTGGIGLQNIRKRLDLQYPGNYSLDIAESNSEFTVQLKIPSL